MGKVKITKVQEENIKRWPNKEQLITAKAAGLLEHGQDEAVGEMSMERLVRALYIGYEVEPEYKAGDWIVIADGNAMIGEVYKIDRVKDCAVLLDQEGYCWWLFSQIRHATPEEIKAEQERRVWTKIGRKVGEFKDGDIGVCERIYWNDPDDLKNLYKEGILESFYPVESRISFGGGEE